MNLWISLWNISNTTSPGFSLFEIPQCHHSLAFVITLIITVVGKLNLLKWECLLWWCTQSSLLPVVLQLALWSHKMSRDVSLAKQPMKDGLTKTTWDHNLEYLNTTETVPIHVCYCVRSWELNLLMENKVWRFYFLINAMICAWSTFWARYYQCELVLTGFLLDKNR